MNPGRWHLALPPLLALAGLAAGDTHAATETPPQHLVSLRRQIRSPEEYQKLLAEWKAWTQSNPNDPVGWAQLARAAMYCGAPCDEFVGYAEKAVRLGPDCAEAYSILGRVKWGVYCPGQPSDPDQAIALLERALKLDPSLDEPHYILWTMRRSQGRGDEANAHLRALLDRGEMAEPLVDFGYNLLVGLEPNAILITNGDNDTYPLFALQAARHLRNDVAIVNLSMINLLWFRRDLRNMTPPVPVPLLEGSDEYSPGNEALKDMVDSLRVGGWKRPLYVAVTVDRDSYPIPKNLSMEGVVYRVLPEKPKQDINVEVTARNIDKLYRLQSATSVAVNWEDWSSLHPLVLNYGGAYVRLAEALARGGDLPRARALMIRTLELIEFHHGDREFARSVISTWSGWEPRSREPEQWKKRLNL